MNAPAQLAHVMTEVNQRPVPSALIDALKSRFGAPFSKALVVRAQHGRDESAFTTVPPPAGVVFAERTADVADAVKLCAAHKVPVAMCGEMAGDATLAPMLLALGLREFSLHPATLLELRKAIRDSDLSDLQSRAAKLLQARDRACSSFAARD